MSEPATIQSIPGSRWDALYRWLLVLPAIAALAVYVTTLSRGAFPGESVRLLVQATGLAPRLYIDRPLWSLVIAALARLPAHDFAMWFNLSSAFFGAVAVYLCTRLVAHIANGAIPVYVHRRHPGTVALATLLSGWCAGFFLAFATPFWIAATRAHPATMHLAGLLAAATLLLSFTRRPTDGRLFSLVFLYGIGCVEFNTFIVFAPIFGSFLLLFLWLRDRLSLLRILLMTGAGLAGMSLYLLAAWLVTRTDGYYLRDFQGFWHVIWVYMVDQYRFITRGLPQHGWMLMLIVTAIPWLIGILTVKRALGGDKDKAFRLLYLVMTVLTIMVLFNHPIAPWSLLGMRRLLVTPYLLSASLFGLLVAAWILLPLYCTENAERGWKLGIRRFGGLAPAALSLALVAWAPFRNFPMADGRPAELVNRYAEHIVDSAAGREWLLTDGTLDDHILVAAHMTARSLKLMDLTSGHSQVYQRFLAANFESMRLRGLLQLGLHPFLREWLRTPGIEHQVAVLSMPDLWYAADFTVVPHRLVFRGAREDQLPDADLLWAEHTVFWGEIQPMLRSYREMETPIWSHAAAQFLRHTALAANNLGVFMEDIGRPDLAWQAYRQARELNEHNISALLNLSILTSHDDLLPDHVVQETRIAMERLSETLGKQRFQISGLSQIHGYVRMPHAFADMGWTWALSGNPGMAVSSLRRALALSDAMPGVRSALAGVYLGMAQDTESEAVYRQVLESNPNDPRALIGLARVALVRRQFDVASEYIAAAEQTGVPRARILFERAMITLLTGDDERAREQLNDLVEMQPDNTRAWILLAYIAIRQDDSVALERIIDRIAPFAANDHIAAFVLGEIALVRGDTADAREYFEQALRIRPGNSHALEQLIRHDLIEARYDRVEQNVAKLLAVDSEHAFGNYVLGVLQMRNHQYHLAESAFRKSIDRQRTPYALNDLADVLIRRRRAADAETYAREAVEMAPDSHQTQAILGRVLLHLRRFPEAITVLETALALNMYHVDAAIDLAEALMHEGKTERALGRISHLLQPDSPATVMQRERLTALQRAIQQTD